MCTCTGLTQSTHFPNFVVQGTAADPTAVFSREGFVAKLNADLSHILAATFLGGSGGDSIDAIALNSIGDMYAAGNTDSSEFLDIYGIDKASAADGIFNGLFELFIAKLDPDLICANCDLRRVNSHNGVHSKQPARSTVHRHGK
jgi:hypothetical protein